MYYLLNLPSHMLTRLHTELSAMDPQGLRPLQGAPPRNAAAARHLAPAPTWCSAVPRRITGHSSRAAGCTVIWARGAEHGQDRTLV